jgi:hypothetical protein
LKSHKAKFNPRFERFDGMMENLKEKFSIKKFPLFSDKSIKAGKTAWLSIGKKGKNFHGE